MTSLPLIVEGLVVLLLITTIGYCAVLERRIRIFHDDRESLRRLVAELDEATRRAEVAVGGLAETARSAEAALEGRLGEARALTRALALGNRGQNGRMRKAS